MDIGQDSSNIKHKRKKPHRFSSLSSRYSLPFSKGEEVKTLDLQFTGAYNAGTYTADTQPCQQIPINTTGAIQAINLVQQGAGVSQRIGNKISLKSLRVRFSFVSTGNTSDEPRTSRIMVIYDRNPNKAYPAANFILAESLQDNTISAGTFTSSVNPNWFDRFVVLQDDFTSLAPRDQFGGLQEVSVGTTDQRTFVYDRYIKLHDMESVYDSTGNPMTIARINVGALYVLVIGNFTVNGTDAWQLLGSTRLRFRDN